MITQSQLFLAMRVTIAIVAIVASLVVAFLKGPTRPEKIVVIFAVSVTATVLVVNIPG